MGFETEAGSGSDFGTTLNPRRPRFLQWGSEVGASARIPVITSINGSFSFVLVPGSPPHPKGRPHDLGSTSGGAAAPPNPPCVNLGWVLCALISP